MHKTGKRTRIAVAALTVYALLTSGCAHCRLPQIDPTGEHIFVPGTCNLPCGRPPVGPFGTPAVAAPPVVQAPPATVVTPPAPPPPPRTIRPIHDPGNECAVCINPVRIVAPPGTEVVLLGGLCGPDGALIANQRMEWMVAPGSVGHFVAISERGPLDWLVNNSVRTQKVDNTFAVNVTSPRVYTLNRGTAHTTDDVRVEKGQAWVTLTSPVEGTSHVTVFAPDSPTWDNRKATAQVYWLDAAWSLPPPSVNPIGTRHTFTTTVHKHSNGKPSPGYRVRYEITGGPAAGFAPNGAQVVEVTTNELGQANAEIFQTTPAAGVNTISVQIIRPEGLPGADVGERFVVASGTTQKTWTAPQLVMDKTGPSVGAVGATLTYQIHVRNAGLVVARDVVVTEPATAGLTLASSNPVAQRVGEQHEWRLGDLPPGEARVIEVNFTATQPGAFNNCATARSAEGLEATDCVATTITAPSIDLQVSGPTTAVVGTDAPFEIIVTNRTPTPATGLVIVDRFDAGFEHAVSASPIERELGTIDPGQSQRINVTLRVTRPGELCHTVEIHNAAGLLTSKRVCLTATGGAGAGAPAAGQPGLSIRKEGPTLSNLGEEVLFRIFVTNNTGADINGVTIVDTYDGALRPIAATGGHTQRGAEIVWNLPRLAAGREEIFEVQCRVDAEGRACNRARVDTAQGATASAEACVTIGPATQNLGMYIVDRPDPLPLRTIGTYEITIRNYSNAPERNVTLVATLPPELEVATGTLGPGPTRFTVEGQTIRFEPIVELRPGEEITYRIAVRGVSPGLARLQAQVTSDTTQTPVRDEATTTVAAQ